MNFIQEITSTKYQIFRNTGKEATKLYISHDLWCDIMQEMQSYLVYNPKELFEEVPRLMNLEVYFVGNSPKHFNIV